MKQEQIGGLFVAVGVGLLVASAWYAWGVAGLLSATGIVLVVYGVAYVVMIQDRQRAANFERKKEEIRKRFENIGSDE